MKSLHAVLSNSREQLFKRLRNFALNERDQWRRWFDADLRNTSLYLRKINLLRLKL